MYSKYFDDLIILYAEININRDAFATVFKEANAYTHTVFMSRFQPDDLLIFFLWTLSRIVSTVYTSGHQTRSYYPEWRRNCFGMG